MTEEEFNREKNYILTMRMAKKMLEAGVITTDEYRRLDKLFLDKYNPVLGRVYSELDLISAGVYGINTSR